MAKLSTSSVPVPSFELFESNTNLVDTFSSEMFGKNEALGIQNSFSSDGEIEAKEAKAKATAKPSALPAPLAKPKPALKSTKSTPLIDNKANQVAPKPRVKIVTCPSSQINEKRVPCIYKKAGCTGAYHMSHKYF